MSKKNLRLIVLTGPPGCGKTTLVKNICNVLKKRNFAVSGFFTEEIKSNGTRIGFDVVLLNGKRAPLARVDRGDFLKPRIGKYVVDICSFEECVLPLINSKVESSSVLVLDEIGKMETLSEKFNFEVTKCLDHFNGVILATIPVTLKKSIPLIERIKTHANTSLITVNQNNRDFLISEITDLIVSIKR